jgi:[acyl-carrier-protein] S-malonyltransferase
VSLAVLFPGQGSQHAAMLPWLRGNEARTSLLEQLQRQLGCDWQERARDASWPAWSSRNGVAQKLVTGLNLAAWRVLAPLLPRPAMMAGYSVGELAAYAAAGVFDAETALQLAAKRAAIMDAQGLGADTGLLSIVGACGAAIEKLCLAHGLVVAIRAGVDRCVVGGLRTNLRAAERDASQSGASCQVLGVSLASHTPWLETAVPLWASALQATNFTPPRTTVVVGLTGQVLRGTGELRDALAHQIAAPLRWDNCMDTVAERGVRCVLEVGPGTALSRLWNARFSDIPSRSIDEFHQPAGVVDWVNSALQRE